MTDIVERVQRSRTKGWKMPPNTVYVGRGSAWGNPYRVVEYGKFDDGTTAWAGRHEWELDYPVQRSRAEAATRAVEGFKTWLFTQKGSTARSRIKELRGKNLACWCPTDQPCHADVLLELANAVPPAERPNIEKIEGNQ